MSKHQSTAREILKKPYARVLIPDEDGTYAAQLLEFPGCFAQGDTAAEALEDLEEAAASWIEASREQGHAIPEPLATYGYSGKINLRLPKSIHKQAARFAQREDVSLNQFFTTAIACRVGAEEFYDRMAERLLGLVKKAESAIVMNTAPTNQFISVDALHVSYFPLFGSLPVKSVSAWTLPMQSPTRFSTLSVHGQITDVCTSHAEPAKEIPHNG